MKKCYKCKEEKDISEFHKNKRRSDGLQSYCISCAKIRNRDYYLSTPERNIERAKSFNKARKIAREYIWSYLSENPCVDCGESDIVVLEFDHITDTKVNNVSFLSARGYGLETIKQEIAKCEVRCANCHRRITAKRGNWAVIDY